MYRTYKTVNAKSIGQIFDDNSTHTHTHQKKKKNGGESRQTNEL